MPEALLVFGGFVSGVVAAVGGVVAGVAALVGGLVSGIAAAIGPALSGIISAITAPIAQIASTVHAAVSGITAQLSTGIANLKGFIDATTAPILDPIKNAWTTIHSYIETIKETVAPMLEPFEDVMDVVNTYRDIKILGRILTGSEGIARLVGYVKDGKLLEFGRAVSDLYEMTAATTVAILERQNAEREGFNEKLRYIDTSIRKLIEETQSKALAKVYGRVTDIAGDLLGRVAGINENLERIQRRTEDVPWFQEMLIKSLK